MRFTSSIRRHVSGSSSVTVPRPVIPAECTSTSTGPWRSRTSANAAATEPSSATSHADDAGLLAQIETEHRVAERAEPVHHRDADRTGAPRHDDAAAQWSTFGVVGSADHSVQEPS